MNDYETDLPNGWHEIKVPAGVFFGECPKWFVAVVSGKVVAMEPSDPYGNVMSFEKFCSRHEAFEVGGFEWRYLRECEERMKRSVVSLLPSTMDWSDTLELQ